jgi:hypothetical protein
MFTNYVPHRSRHVPFILVSFKQLGLIMQRWRALRTTRPPVPGVWVGGWVGGWVRGGCARVWVWVWVCTCVCCVGERICGTVA